MSSTGSHHQCVVRTKETNKYWTQKNDLRTETELLHDYSPYRAKFINILSEFQYISDRQTGQIKAAKPRIELDSAGEHPIHSAPYPTGLRAQKFEKQKIYKMLATDVIEPAQTEWAALFFAPKKDGIVQFFMDYRKLNAVSIWEFYQQEHMEECIASFGETAIFSTLHANSGYWQVEVINKDCKKAAFASPHGQFLFIRMLSSLSRTRDVSGRDKHYTILGEVAICTALS